MATLVLGAVGTAVGGPIGGAIGALIGGAADRSLLPAKGRAGPRLADLRVQTSAYGSAVPRLFGRLRVAGTVIWATDLREDRTTSGGGKAGPKTTSYSYSASFAVALSARPIRGVGRIWADGRLLRGEAGDWKSRTGFRLHLGDEDQPADPLMAAAEGIAGCPAYRGTAYAVFEDMALAEFGNRIPSLTFEVEADAGPVDVAAIAADLAGGGLGGAAGEALGGFAAAGTVRGVLEGLAEVIPVRLTDAGGTLRLDALPAGACAVPADALGAAPGEDRAERRLAAHTAVGLLPREVAIGHYDPARDWQAGSQRARREGATGPARTIDLAAGLDATRARGLAEAALARAWTEARQLTLRLPWRWLALRPGAVIAVAGEAGRWRVARATLEEMVWTLELRRIAAATLPAPASSGRPVREADATAGSTRLVLLDLPPIDGTEAGPALWAAAAGTGAGWRRATLSLSLDGGASWNGIGDTAAPAILGEAVTVLAPGDPALFDRRGSVLVDLANAAMSLTGADDARLIAGANAAMLGGELIQFGGAEQIGPRRWLLSRLLRGRRGTEAAVVAHAAGEPFVLVERAALVPVPVSAGQIGAAAMLSALGPDEAQPAQAQGIVTARALRPPSPVFLRAEARDGALRLNWVRRSRTGWAWLDGTDAPLGEEAERYRVTLRVGGAVVRVVEPGEPRFDYPDALRGADGADGGFVAEVRQLGQAGASDPATLSIG